jgi:hypothetical protein
MSPYQQDGISTTLSEFDRQRQIAQQQIGAGAVMLEHLVEQEKEFNKQNLAHKVYKTEQL